MAIKIVAVWIHLFGDYQVNHVEKGLILFFIQLLEGETHVIQERKLKREKSEKSVLKKMINLIKKEVDQQNQKLPSWTKWLIKSWLSVYHNKWEAPHNEQEAGQDEQGAGHSI